MCEWCQIAKNGFMGHLLAFQPIYSIAPKDDPATTRLVHCSLLKLLAALGPSHGMDISSLPQELLESEDESW